MQRLSAVKALHIGLDLDNTLIDYSAVFGRVGVSLGLLPEKMGDCNKVEVRSYLRTRPDGELEWMRLQGQVYGAYLEHACLYAGVAECLMLMKAAGARISIVSHKTRYGHYDPAQVDLWDATMRWLDRRGFFADNGFAISAESVFFEASRDAKLARIESLACDVFVDDLPEVLLHPSFPRRTERMWFAHGQPASAGSGLQAYHSWQDLARALETRLSNAGKNL